jgi:hypothetical protein
MRILRLLSNRPLPCGCLAGIYETYDGPIVWIIDSRDGSCRDPRHRPGAPLKGAEHGDVTGTSRLPSPGWLR